MGARTRLFRADKALGMPHFAYFRAVLQGLEPRLAWQRYLALGAETPEPRRMQRLHQQLWADLLQRAQWRCAGLPPQAPLAQALRLLQDPRPQAPVARALPSLEEFIERQGLDPDHFSQAELLQEYAEHHGLNTAPGRGQPASDRSAASQLRALATLSEALVQSATPSDRLDLWLAQPTLKPLLAAGLVTLIDLAQRMQTHGGRWWGTVPGLGRVRAQALSGWLQEASAAWTRPVRVIDIPPAARAAQRLAPWPAQPLPASPRPLRLKEDSAQAADPSERPRLLPAQQVSNPHPAGACWHQALAWLDALTLSPLTRRAYSKEAERFVLWCHLERQRRLEQTTPIDLQAYAEFLAHLPPEWVEPEPLPRSAARWRPFRGPLAPGSVRYALALVGRLVDGVQGRALTPAQRLAGEKTAAHLIGAGCAHAEPPASRSPAPGQRPQPEVKPEPATAEPQPRAPSAVQRRRALLSALDAWRPGPPVAWAGAVWWTAPTAQAPADAPPSALTELPLVRTAQGQVLALPPAVALALRRHHADLPACPDGPDGRNKAELSHHECGGAVASEGRQPAPVLVRLRGSVGRWALGPEGPHFVPGDGRRGGALSSAGLRRVHARARARAGTGPGTPEAEGNVPLPQR